MKHFEENFEKENGYKVCWFKIFLIIHYFSYKSQPIFHLPTSFSSHLLLTKPASQLWKSGWMTFPKQNEKLRVSILFLYACKTLICLFRFNHKKNIFILGLKEEAEIGNRSRHGSGASSSGERLEPPDIPPSMEQTLNIILLKLGDKRRDAKRPEDVDVRTTLISGWY